MDLKGHRWHWNSDDFRLRRVSEAARPPWYEMASLTLHLEQGVPKIHPKRHVSTMLDVITVNICKILLVLGFIFPIYKILNKSKIDGSTSYSTTKRVLYQLHVNGSKVAVIFGFVHGLIMSPINQIYTITGWFFGIVMVILMGLGAFLSIKTNSKPMSRDDDVKWRKIRIIKWIITVLVFSALALHYLLSDWLQ